MSNFFLFTLLIFLCGCIKNIEQTSFIIHADQAEISELKEACEEIKNTGNLKSLLSQIKRDVRSITELSENYQDQHYDQIIRLSQRIDENSQLVKIKLDPKFQEIKYPFTIHWDINLNHHRSFFGRLVRGLRYINAEKTDAYLFGVQRKDLLENFDLELIGHRLFGIYQGYGSALEICELNATRSLLIKIDFSDPLRRGQKFFNLTHFREPSWEE